MRTFVAVEIDNNNILQKIKSMQESVSFEAKPVRIDQIHFTLQFLGEINLDQIEQVKKALKMVDFPKFDLTIINSGAFPNSRNPRVVWLGVDKDGGEKIRKMMKSIGLPVSLREVGVTEDNLDFLIESGFIPFRMAIKRIIIPMILENHLE